MNTWPCEHISRAGNRWTICCNTNDVSEWVACPWCGAKRPSEPVGLGEKLYKHYPNCEKLSDKCFYECMTKIMLDHYFSPENERALAEYMKNNGTLFIDVFAKRICSWFRSLK